ncbi:MAG TPA: hypothetical protein VFH95_00325 [Candidatus Kapabacteria bacterium]|nr:hypothetical protein [Candidatus Kapabacteria bacterium]
MFDFLFILFLIVCALAIRWVSKYVEPWADAMRPSDLRMAAKRRKQSGGKKMTEQVLEDFIHLKKFHHSRGVH